MLIMQEEHAARLFETKRLTLLPFSLELIKATLAGKETLSGLLQVKVLDTWPGEDFAEVLPALAKQMESEQAKLAWNWLIIHRQDRAIIGDMGFFSGPRDGEAEIGYSVVEQYRNQGYATEAAQFLIPWALRQNGIEQVIAECLPDNAGSIRVLEKAGMRRLPVDGSMVQWEMKG